jgi:hypothetical protein
MSHRLKKGIKTTLAVLRAEEKEFWKTFERKPMSGFPRPAAIGVLARPFPAKQTNPRRKRMMKALSSEILVPRITPKDPAVKLAQDLQTVPLCRLINLIKHSARHASTVKHLAAKCTPGSVGQQKLAAVQTYHLGVMKQAQAEYTVRTSPRI